MIVHRVIQILLGGFCAFMIWGGGFFWLEFLPNNFTKTTTYTLYSTLHRLPKGPLSVPSLCSGNMASSCHAIISRLSCGGCSTDILEF